MIRKATPTDLDIIKSLTEACTLAMQQKGIFQWNDQYPSRERLAEDIKNEELYLLEDEKIMGIIVLSPVMDEEYVPIPWLTKSEKNLYVHRLATHPEIWGKGYGGKLMDYAERHAAEGGYLSVRLDTFSINKRNLKFYENRGYSRMGSIYFPKQSEHPFFCFEKEIN